jgi:hypothetical protein
MDEDVRRFRRFAAVSVVIVAVVLASSAMAGPVTVAVPHPQVGQASGRLLLAQRAERKVTKEEKRVVRRERSRVGGLGIALKRSQPVFVKAFRTEDAVFVNAKSTKEDEARRQKKMTAELLQKRMVDKLLVFRFDAKPYPEDESKANVKDALVVDGAIDKITFGKADTLCVIRVKIYAADDPNKILAQYDDGEPTEKLAGKLGRRFDLTAGD